MSGCSFIILTTALTLHRNGITHIQTSEGAAEALRPLAGNLAALLFTLGIIGVGFLAVPIMSASAAYAAAEIFGWRVGINKRFKTARAFYAIIILSTLVGIAIDFANVNAIKALFGPLCSTACSHRFCWLPFLSWRPTASSCATTQLR